MYTGIISLNDINQSSLNGEVWWSLWGTDWILKCYLDKLRFRRANSRLAIIEIPRLSWNQNISCSQESVTVSDESSPHTHLPIFHFFKIHFNIIPPSVPMWSVHLTICVENFELIFHGCHVSYKPCPTHPAWTDNHSHMLWRMEIAKFHIIQSSPTSYFWATHIRLSPLFL
jgi:hypothetical protein